jgi:hypothetical protein
MANEQRDRLLLVAAELADERARVTRLLSEFDHAARRLAEPWHSNVFQPTLGGKTLQAIFRAILDQLLLDDLKTVRFWQS